MAATAPSAAVKLDNVNTGWPKGSGVSTWMTGWNYLDQGAKKVFEKAQPEIADVALIGAKAVTSYFLINSFAGIGAVYNLGACGWRLFQAFSTSNKKESDFHVEEVKKHFAHLAPDAIVLFSPWWLKLAACIGYAMKPAFAERTVTDLTNAISGK